MAAGSKKVIYAAFAGNALIAVTKFAGLDRAIRQRFPRAKRIFVEAEARRGDPESR